MFSFLCKQNQHNELAWLIHEKYHVKPRVEGDLSNMKKKYCISLATPLPNGHVGYQCTPVDRETAVECLRNHGWSADDIESGLADCDEGDWIPVSDTVSIC